MSNFFYRKMILVTGGTGLIGIPLVRKLVNLGARVRAVSLDKQAIFGKEVNFIRADLCEKGVCSRVLKDIQVVFHLAGIKGGLGVAQSKASTFLVKNILMDTQIMEAARNARLERFLYVSSICVYPPAKVFKEESAGTGLPHSSDRFGGMAKLIGEMQIEAYRIQYQIKNFLIARPVNTYGPYDNFNSVSALIIPALIYRIFNGENPLTVWGDGTAVRDFVFSEDVADFLILMVKENAAGPFNVGSGNPLTIKKIAQTIVFYAEEFLKKKIYLRWDRSKPSGEKYRVASVEKARIKLGWTAPTDIKAGILKTIAWYSERKKHGLLGRYSILSQRMIS